MKKLIKDLLQAQKAHAESRKRLVKAFKRAFPIGSNVTWKIRRRNTHYIQRGTVIENNHHFLHAKVRNNATGTVRWLDSYWLIEGAAR